MPRRRKSKKRSNKKKTLFSVTQPELQETEKQSDHETSIIDYSKHTVLEVSYDTLSPTPLDEIHAYLSKSSITQAETQDGICLNKRSSKIHYKFTSQSPETDVQQINAKTQADDETLLNVIESADLDQAVQLLKGNNHFSQDGLDRALISACRHGLKILVQELVCLEANVQFKDTLGNTPLLICAENGFIDIVHFLLKMKADVNAFNSAGDTALILSIRPAGSLEMVRVLLDQNGIDICHQNRDGYTALMKAVEVRDVDVIKILMDYNKEEVDGTTSRGLLLEEVDGTTSIDSGQPCCPESIEAINSKGMSAEGIADKCGLGNIYNILKTYKRKTVSLLDTAIERHDTESLNMLLNCHFVGKQDIQESFINIFKNVNLKEFKMFTEMEMVIIKRLLIYGAEVTNKSWYGGSTSLSGWSPPLSGWSTSLSVAVNIGDYDLVELLCQHLDQQHQQSSQDFYHPLIAAAKSGRCDLINLLLKYKADINNENHYSGSPLDCALSHGHLESAKLLVRHGAKIDIKSALQSAVTQQLTEYMNFVFENYQPEVVSYAATVGNDLNKLLVSASKGGNLEIIGRLLDAGADVNHEMSGETPLGESKDVGVARFLINRGANVNLELRYEVTPLLYILNKKNIKYSSSIEVVKVLLENGASANESDYEGTTPLMATASEEESVAMLQILLDHGADINSQDIDGNTALMVAVQGSCPQNVSFLLEFHKEKSLSINVQNNEGETALVLAVIEGNLKILKQLIDFGADVNIKDKNGNTPLHCLITRSYRSMDIVTTLIKAEIDINCQNNDGFSPLMLAARYCLKDAIISLLVSGADVNAVSEKDSTKTALSFLTDYGDHNFKFCLEAFLTQGASSSFMKNDLLHRMIMADKIDVIPELIKGGLGPADVESKIGIFVISTHKEIPTVSPLCVSLLMGNVSLARYLLGNLFLTNSDVTSLLRNKILHQVLERRQLPDSVNFLEELSTQPLSLFQLAFVTVLSAVGSSPGRENRVNMLPLPQVMKDKLLFKSQEIQLNVSIKDNDCSGKDKEFTIFDFLFR